MERKMIRAEINEMETIKKYKLSMKQKVDKSLTKLTKRRREMTQINKITMSN
jgi:hypothetical protein